MKLRKLKQERLTIYKTWLICKLIHAYCVATIRGHKGKRENAQEWV